MLKQSDRKSKFRAVVCFLEIMLVAALVMAGCATTEKIQTPSDQREAATAAPTSSEEKMITDLSVNETADAITVTIEANHVLDYTLAEPPLQQSKVLYFPDSALDLVKSEYPVNNEVIGTIQAVELVKGGPSKIVIPIKIPGITCEAHRGDNDHILQVVFPRTGSGEYARTETLSEDTIAEEPVQPAEETFEPSEEPVSSYQPMEAEAVGGDMTVEPATRLEDVDIQKTANRVNVKIKADGTIEEHKTFTLKNPPRIVVDLTGLTSPYKKEQRLAVDSNIVNQVRHCGHPGYLRVVLDVNQSYLSDYKLVPLRDGLMVYVGNTADLAQVTPEPESRWEPPAEEVSLEEPDEAVRAEEMQDEETFVPPMMDVEEESLQPVAEDNDVVGEYDRAALVNQIDFIEDGGKSTIRIGTTHPIKFKLYKTGAKKIRLTLENADILSFRQRPLITTRFDSAINSIIPLQTQEMKEKGISVVDINLREDVSYNTERQDNQILVHFEPSNVPPEPAEDVVIPTEVEITEKTEAPGEMGVSAEDQMETQAEPTATSGEKVSVGNYEWEEEPGAPEETPVMQTEKKTVYTGEPIALEFYKTDIRNVIRILKDVSGKNFAIDEGVTGSVTLSFVNPVPWDQVLDLVLDMNNLGMIEKGGIVRISTRETILKQKESARAAMAAEQELKTTEEQLAPLVTEYFAISYSDASSDILPHIEDILTEGRGHAKVDTRTNQLIMTDIQEKIDKAREIIKKIDKVTPQVMINARIVETNTNFSREFGTEWGLANRPGGTYRHELGGTYTYDVAMNNPANTVANTLGINFSRIVGTPFSLDAKLSLMESVGEVRIISSPRVVTLDNKTASISQGQEIPYTTVDDGEADTQFKDADLKLEVTPHVTPDNRISMKIHIEEKEIGEQGGLDEPPLNTKQADTELLVNDGDTIVIGGIIQETEREGQSGIPLLSHIPLLGHLFKQQNKSSEKSELLIFITPTIVRLD